MGKGKESEFPEGGGRLPGVSYAALGFPLVQ